jgi:hypothetical protein
METYGQDPALISSDRVEGTKVVNREGEKLGSVDHLMIEKQTGQVRYAVLSFGGFLGIGEDQYPLPWDMLSYNPRLDAYQVDIAKEQLDDAPRHPRGSAPAYDEAWTGQVRRHYGQVTPTMV